jgi:hypothetical protein
MHYIYRLRIMDHLFKSYIFTRVMRSQSTLQRQLRRQIQKNTLYILLHVELLRSSSNQKTLYSTRGPLKRAFHSRFKMAHSCLKRPNL